MLVQVGASTGHKVTLVDLSADVLTGANKRISESIRRVAKKQFKVYCILICFTTVGKRVILLTVIQHISNKLFEVKIDGTFFA
jgi:hypothetical protein